MNCLADGDHEDNSIGDRSIDRGCIVSIGWGGTSRRLPEMEKRVFIYETCGK